MAPGNEAIVFHVLDKVEINFPFEALTEFTDSLRATILPDCGTSNLELALSRVPVPAQPGVLTARGFVNVTVTPVFEVRLHWCRVVMQGGAL